MKTNRKYFLENAVKFGFVKSDGTTYEQDLKKILQDESSKSKRSRKRENIHSKR